MYGANRRGRQTDVDAASDSSSCVSGASLFAGSCVSSTKSSCIAGSSKKRQTGVKADDETLAELLKKKGKPGKGRVQNPELVQRVVNFLLNFYIVIRSILCL